LGDSQGTQGSPRVTIVRQTRGLASIPKLVIGSNVQACIVILKKPFVPTRVRIETFQQAGALESLFNHMGPTAGRFRLGS
jgi:hypothetical protein